MAGRSGHSAERWTTPAGRDGVGRRIEKPTGTRAHVNCKEVTDPEMRGSQLLINPTQPCDGIHLGALTSLLKGGSLVMS